MVGRRSRLVGYLIRKEQLMAYSHALRWLKIVLFDDTFTRGVYLFSLLLQKRGVERVISYFSVLSTLLL